MEIRWDDGVSLTSSIDKTAESAEQDQTAYMCSPIFLYTLFKVKLWSQMASKG